VRERSSERGEVWWGFALSECVRAGAWAATPIGVRVLETSAPLREDDVSEGFLLTGRLVLVSPISSDQEVAL
jgi:hypothetical protein